MYRKHHKVLKFFFIFSFRFSLRIHTELICQKLHDRISSWIVSKSKRSSLHLCISLSSYHQLGPTWFYFIVLIKLTIWRWDTRIIWRILISLCFILLQLHVHQKVDVSLSEITFHVTKSKFFYIFVQIFPSGTHRTYFPKTSRQNQFLDRFKV